MVSEGAGRRGKQQHAPFPLCAAGIRCSMEIREYGSGDSPAIVADFRKRRATNRKRESLPLALATHFSRPPILHLIRSKPNYSPEREGR